jgi:hypothetical protein
MIKTIRNKTDLHEVPQTLEKKNNPVLGKRKEEFTSAKERYR